MITLLLIAAAMFATFASGWCLGSARRARLVSEHIHDLSERVDAIQSLTVEGKQTIGACQALIALHAHVARNRRERA